jgi:putative hydrolase of the HAD superfamily
VGLKKPDPAIYALAERRLGVEPQDVVFLDDATANVEAAQAAGWQAVLHESTPRSIEALERIITNAAR